MKTRLFKLKDGQYTAQVLTWFGWRFCGWRFWQWQGEGNPCSYNRAVCKRRTTKGAEEMRLRWLSDKGFGNPIPGTEKEEES